MSTEERLEKILLGTNQYATDEEFLLAWKKLISVICKPCWELKYCPYGPLVEDFPPLPPTKAETIAHNSYLKRCLETGMLADGSELDDAKRKRFVEMIAISSKRPQLEKIPNVFREASCNVFGHICPVFLVSEPFTETKDTRRSGRYIPRAIMLKVVRRDGQVCQECHDTVPDTLIHFDHIIPVSKGGSVSVENLRILCEGCNRKKGNSLDALLD